MVYIAIYDDYIAIDDDYIAIDDDYIAIDDDYRPSIWLRSSCTCCLGAI